MTGRIRARRLSTVAAALVVARRDFTAILFSRSFFFFLLGPLFPVLVGVMAGGVGQRVQQSTESPGLGIAMEVKDVDAMLAARAALASRLGSAVPELVVVDRLAQGAAFDPQKALSDSGKGVSAIVSGSPGAPVLSGAPDLVSRWEGPVSMIAAQALGEAPRSYPHVRLVASNAGGGTVDDRKGRVMTAQAGQTLLFLLTMLLAGMVLSNLVEEKANKIIEVLAAAIPMDAVFFGKLFAMLAVSLVGIVVWGLAGGAFMLLAGQAVPDLPVPAVGWPLFLALGVIYFAMAYLLLGSLFLTIGSMATTVREVQTLSMPVTMLQLMVFFLASYAMTQPGSTVELAVAVFPLSSPFAMLARAAQDGALLPHVAALVWQALCVVVFVRFGAKLFRTRVMKSGAGGRPGPVRRLFARLRPARGRA